MQFRSDFSGIEVTSGGLAPLSRAARRAERRLAQAALRGDPAARDRFLARMVCIPRYVRHLDLHQRLQPCELEDLAQLTFERLWAKLPEFRGEASLEVFAFRIARYVYSERYRQLARRPAHVSLTALREGPEDPRSAQATAFGPEQDALLAAFDDLPPATRALVRLRVLEGQSFEELAEGARVSAAVLRKRFQRALRWVRAQAQRALNEEGDRR